MVRSYRVRWEIDIYANTPREAAQEARRIQRDPESTATVFAVDEWLDSKGFIVKPATVDLSTKEDSNHA